MVTARTKILRHIWENSGGYINNYGNVILVTKVALPDANIHVNIDNVTVEKTIHQGQNVAMLKGLVVSRGKGYLFKVLTGICIDNRFYRPIDKAYKSTRLANGNMLDTYWFAMVEEYADEDKPKKSKK